jgi:catechol 2,3-dioxygenase-like lactoylglutathione lyase family enzyme
MAQSPRSVSAITLFVQDLARSKDFYERVFQVTGVVEADAGTVILEFDNLFLRLLTRSEAEKEMLGQVPLADPGSGASFELAMFVTEAGRSRRRACRARSLDRLWPYRPPLGCAPRLLPRSRRPSLGPQRRHPR